MRSRRSWRLPGGRALTPARGARRRLALAWGGLLLAAVSCAQMPAKPGAAIESTLISATANGKTTLSWQSRTNLVYTVLVSDRWNAQRWEALPACTRQRGTGKVMEYVIPETPGQQRIYKLYVAPLAPLSRR